ncbi:hypothetical protein T492DRAFT_858874 [Pavlovales sp. CCMP2436]|nr:hypothetical protein T492DRAFT_858874 [Pavlovales sp. CCMP2436]
MEAGAEQLHARLALLEAQAAQMEAEFRLADRALEAGGRMEGYVGGPAGGEGRGDGPTRSACSPERQARTFPALRSGGEAAVNARLRVRETSRAAVRDSAEVGLQAHGLQVALSEWDAYDAEAGAEDVQQAFASARAGSVGWGVDSLAASNKLASDSARTSGAPPRDEAPARGGAGGREALAALAGLQPPHVSARRSGLRGKFKGKGKSKGKSKSKGSSRHREATPGLGGPSAPTGVSAREITARNAEMVRRRHEQDAAAAARRLAEAGALAAGVLHL